MVLNNINGGQIGFKAFGDLSVIFRGYSGIFGGFSGIQDLKHAQKTRLKNTLFCLSESYNCVTYITVQRDNDLNKETVEVISVSELMSSARHFLQEENVGKIVGKNVGKNVETWV